MRTDLPVVGAFEVVEGAPADPVPARTTVSPRWFLAPVGVAVLNIAWFAPFPGRTLMGDDLELLLEARSGGYASDFVKAFSQVGAEKFRPIVTAILAVFTDAFGINFTSYRTANLVLQGFNVCLVGLIAWRLSKRSWAIAVTAMVLVTISRFNTYFVLQIYGVMEGLALTFVLATILAVMEVYRTASRRALLAASLCYLLATFTHERYIVLGPFLVLATLLAPVPFRSRSRRALWAVLPVLVAFSNVAVKVWALKINYFTAGGGEDVGFTPGQTATFMGRALLNILGFNSGPDYLSGKNMHALGALGTVLGLALTVPAALAFAALLRSEAPALREGRVVALRKYVLAASLLAPLLLAASISFRQEYRWLYTPFVVLVLGISWMLGQVPVGRRLRMGLVAAVFLGGVAVDGYYRRHVENTYFFDGLRTADSVRSEILGRHRSDLDVATVFIFSHDDPTLPGWYLRGDGFFKIYAPGSDLDVRLVTAIDTPGVVTDVRSRVLAFDYRYDSVVDVTTEFFALRGAELAHAQPG